MAAATSNAGLRLGVVTDSESQGGLLTELICQTEHQVVALLLSDECALERLLELSGGVDAWLLDVDFDQGDVSGLESWLGSSSQPVVITEGVAQDGNSPDFFAWQRRLLEKLGQLAGQIRCADSPLPAAREVWVLGASTGGPQAVREFVEALPAGLGIAFIYVQHIDSGFEVNLLKMLSRSHYRAFLATQGDVLQPNTVAVMQSNYCLDILESGALMQRQRSWSGPYRPSVDQVMVNVARYYSGRSGAVVFSGMGNDGASGCRHMARHGCPVWVQSPDSCTVASMPEAALATGHVSAVGSPATLAGALAQRIQGRQARSVL